MDFLEGLAIGALARGPRAPSEEATPVYEGPAPSRKVATGTTYDEAAWLLLQRRHPRFYKKLMKDLQRAQRLHRFYVGKVR